MTRRRRRRCRRHTSICISAIFIVYPIEFTARKWINRCEFGTRRIVLDEKRGKTAKRRSQIAAWNLHWIRWAFVCLALACVFRAIIFRQNVNARLIFMHINLWFAAIDARAPFSRTACVAHNANCAFRLGWHWTKVNAKFPFARTFPQTDERILKL